VTDRSWIILTVVVAGAAAGLSWLVGRVLARAFRHRPAIAAFLHRARWPVRLLAAATALRAVVTADSHHYVDVGPVSTIVSVLLIVAVTWLVLRILDVVTDALLGRFDITPRDNLRARRIRTQVGVLRQTASVLVVLVAGVAVLSLFDWGRDLARNILAAGGIISIVVGIAGRSTIGNFIAGLQIAFTEPIRLDDVVVVEGQWGRVEEITLAHVVLRLWDDRRLVLPTTHFVETPFENWTHHTSEVLGSIELWVDFMCDIGAMRAEVERLATTSPLWDGREVKLQVVDAADRAVKVRALVSAADPPTAFDLRCAIREALVKWLNERPGVPVVRLAPFRELKMPV
jgi:small-conductance mechanosensitive channel